MGQFMENFYNFSSIDMQLDISKMDIPSSYFKSIGAKLEAAYEGIKKIESGEIMNVDEKRMVGHYWLRNHEIAPTADIKNEIFGTVEKIKNFVRDVHNGKITSPTGVKFENVLLIGIGGSCLGPQFVSRALSTKSDKMSTYFMDNTDPDGIDMVLSSLESELDKTLVIVISKSGGTVETRNGMVETKHFYTSRGKDFASHAIAVTGVGSLLYNTCISENWLDFFPMWDFVGGRTSVMSAVGLLPLALQGIDIDELMRGARMCDNQTRIADFNKNPAAILASTWLYMGDKAKGTSMVMLPYKDRLELFSKYLQQLVMESLGKTFDLDGKAVYEGLPVYGNKGATDQHSYVQQLLEGPDNYFAVFIEVLKDREGASEIVLENSTSGDYLSAFYMGTRAAMEEKGRKNVTITVPKVSEFTVGLLIALFERAVSIYALAVNINAYHQPGVESGKKAANKIIAVKNQAVEELAKGGDFTAKELSEKIGCDFEMLFKILRHLGANGIVSESDSDDIFSRKYKLK